MEKFNAVLLASEVDYLPDAAYKNTDIFSKTTL